VERSLRFAPTMSAVYCGRRNFCALANNIKKASYLPRRLREEEDRSIRAAAKLQEDIGLQGITARCGVRRERRYGESFLGSGRLNRRPYR
jgi:hypothetical protein